MTSQRRAGHRAEGGDKHMSVRALTSGHWQRAPLPSPGERDSQRGWQLQSPWHCRCLPCTRVLWRRSPGARADLPTAWTSLALGEAGAGVVTLLPGLPDTGRAGACGKLARPNGAGCSFLHPCLPKTVFLLFKVLKTIESKYFMTRGHVVNFKLLLVHGVVLECGHVCPLSLAASAPPATPKSCTFVPRRVQAGLLRKSGWGEGRTPGGQARSWAGLVEKRVLRTARLHSHFLFFDVFHCTMSQ